MGDDRYGLAYRTLADLVDGLESNGVRVERVETDAVDEGAGGLSITLDIEVPLDRAGPLRIPPERAASAGAAAGTDTGTGARTRLSPNENDTGESTADSSGDPVGSAAGTDAAPAAPDDPPTDDAEGYECEAEGCSARFESTAERDIHVETAHRAPETPPHRNEAALEIAYQAFDSFPRMAEALDADVTPQTVRRHMMDAGIHQLDDGDGAEDSRTEEVEPDTDAGTTDDATADAGTTDGADGDPGAGESGDDARTEESPQGRRVTDGAGGGAVAAGATSGSSEAATEPGTPEPVASGMDLDLPSDVDPGALRRVAVDSRTLRQAAGELDLSRDRTREVLGDLGLLELVHGRLSGRLDREEREAEFEAWLAERADESERQEAE